MRRHMIQQQRKHDLDQNGIESAFNKQGEKMIMTQPTSHRSFLMYHGGTQWHGQLNELTCIMAKHMQY
ncbi:hypothetical protein SESBI_36744 [Sesbania bispinosa]|nr:hypothetical protein SESBI_36744 [Sesbania bispinosa]